MLVNGARQAGKSTLTRLVVAQRPRAAVRLLDEPAMIESARNDPMEFVRHDDIMVIDEIQPAPELLRPIKTGGRPRSDPGSVPAHRFITYPPPPNVAGRAARPHRDHRTLAVFQGEIHNGPNRFVDAAFTHGSTLEYSSSLRKRDYLERVVVGGFPEAVRRSPRRRPSFFDAYLTTLVERDVLELANIERQGDLFRLLRILATRAGSLLTPSSLTSPTGIPRTTLTRYLELLTSVFLIKTIPAWSSGQTRRAIGTPKLGFVDTGIAGHLIGQDEWILGMPVVRRRAPW